LDCLRSGPAAFLAVAMLAASVASAKPLYLTVPRAFGTTERPAVDVAFEESEPVELRVLRPRDLDAFVRTQSNLRRAWEQPPVRLNPGRYLARGLNAVTNPLWVLRRAADEPFRRGVSPGLPPTPPDAGRMHLAEAASRLVDVPAGMETVRSEWLNLDLGGSEREFQVPGFATHGYGWQERRVRLAPLPAGVYVVQLVQGRVEGQVLLVVTDLAVQVKQTDGEVLVRVAGRDGLAREKAAVSLFAPSGPGPAGETDAHGEVRLSTQEPRLLAVVRTGADTALADTDFHSSLAVTPDVFLYSDRPIYRPGDEVHFRGIVRQPESFLSRLLHLRDRHVRVRLVSTAGAAGTGITAGIDDFGSFSGSFHVPEGLDTGVLRLVAELQGHDHQAEARVQQYVKPTFYAELVGGQDSVTPGAKLKAHVRARRFAGGPAAGAEYDVFLYRTLLESPAWIDDAGMGARGSAVTYDGLSSMQDRLSLPERLYSSVAERLSRTPSDDPWAGAPRLDPQGEADVEIAVPAAQGGDDLLPWKYSLAVRLRDDQGATAAVSRAYVRAPADVMASVSVRPPVVTTGEVATIAVRSVTPGGRLLPGVSGSVQYVLRAPGAGEILLAKNDLHTGADGIWRGAVPSARAGTVMARIVLRDAKGRVWNGEAKMLVAGTGGEPVAEVPALTLEAAPDPLEPGDEARVVAMLPAERSLAQDDRGSIWVTLSGAGIFETAQIPLDGRTLVYRFRVEPRFGSAVYASVAYPTAEGRWEERTAPFRVIPSARALSVRVRPGKEEAAPLGPQTLHLQVTDAAGRGVASQVSVGVVDKAIYSLQPEFRPPVLDFFYPLVRDNVQTFQSSEFQGYGYGELLAGLRGRLPGHRFASIKPPTKKPDPRESDTAYWNPSVLTDADGHASVAFVLPSNQTTWVATAVAADASGRFGESTAEFAARGQVSIVAALPLFLREGDTARASVRVAAVPPESTAKPENGTPPAAENGTSAAPPAAPSAISVTVSTSADDLLGGGRADVPVKLEATGENVLPVKLRASRAGRGSVSFSVTGLAEPLRDRRDLPVHPATVLEEVSARAVGGGKLDLAVPYGAEVASAELVLRPTSVEAALGSVRELLAYPWGCLEQLVSTTVPNLAVYRTLEDAGALEKLDPSSRALLAEARSRSEQGVHRILALAVKGGGFTWFSGYSTPSAPLTLIALDGLSYAADAGLVDRHDARLRESADWLASRTDLPPELQATREYVLARLLGTERAAAVRSMLKREAHDAYGAALAVLAAQAAGIGGEADAHAAMATLGTRAKDGLAELASWTPESRAWWLYPLRRVGLTAVVTHAASSAGADVADARSRLVQALSDTTLSTFDRSTALLHSLWLVERDAKELRAMTPPGTNAGGKPLALEPRGGGLAAAVDPATRSVTVEPFEGLATLRAQVRVPMASVRPVSQGMSLERAYHVLRGGTKVALTGDATVTEGEDVFVELKVDAKAGTDRSGYWMIEDAVPAGFEPVTEDKEYRAKPLELPLSHASLRSRSLGAERATFFFEDPAPWSESARVVGWVMRARFPGRFAVPPASASDMYAHAVRARTGAATLTVKETEADSR